MQSDWRGEGRKMMPKRSKSYRAAPVCVWGGGGVGGCGGRGLGRSTSIGPEVLACKGGSDSACRRCSWGWPAVRAGCRPPHLCASSPLRSRPGQKSWARWIPCGPCSTRRKKARRLGQSGGVVMQVPHPPAPQWVRWQRCGSGQLHKKKRVHSQAGDAASLPASQGQLLSGQSGWPENLAGPETPAPRRRWRQRADFTSETWEARCGCWPENPPSDDLGVLPWGSGALRAPRFPDCWPTLTSRGFPPVSMPCSPVDQLIHLADDISSLVAGHGSRPAALGYGGASSARLSRPGWMLLASR